MTGCCTIRPHDDGIIDPEAINRAIAGGPVELTRRERAVVIAKLRDRGWGADRISQHLGYARTEVASLLASIRSPR
jgi:hypothetical protein